PLPAPVSLALDGPGETRTVQLDVPRPTSGQASTTVHAVVRLSDGRGSGGAVNLLEYSHVRPTPYVVPAQATVRLAPLALPAVGRVGYVRGAGDLVPEALRQVGVPLDLLGQEQLARGDLAPYQAIIIGPRAYETDSALTRHNARLLEYARGGGLLVVQYQQYAFVTGRYAPYGLTMGRPHDRVTDETAPVVLLQPDHQVFQRPNRITAEDWEGWPQERGLYFAREWDGTFVPLVETHDPDMPPLRGGLLMAPLGAGTYVYTGLAFFRALPAGAVGAYRVFLNLLALHQSGPTGGPVDRR
ncbi:MAG TPA: hypothetical protein VD793_03705, partial [Gemmatimonadales bacterium]|nr:hypothetical protein [Gemmatimonadales bacterium]